MFIFYVIPASLNNRESINCSSRKTTVSEVCAPSPPLQGVHAKEALHHSDTPSFL